jgi:glucose-6-phosphate 1-dehydrogenase
MTVSIIVLGATGDLTSRYLLPGLAQVLPEVAGGLQLIGVSQEKLTTERFRAHLHESLARNAGDVDERTRSQFASQAHYVGGDVTDPATLTAAFAEVGGDLDAAPVVLYLALPHVLFDEVVKALGSCRGEAVR